MLDVHQRGFTLVELMVTLSIGGILMGMAVNAYASMRENTRVESAKEEIISILQQARLKALSSGETQKVKFLYATDTVEYSESRRNPVTGFIISNTLTKSFDGSINLVGCTSGADQLTGDTTFTFRRRGTGTLDSMRVLSTSNGRAFKVLVSNVGGRIRVEQDGVCS